MQITTDDNSRTYTGRIGGGADGRYADCYANGVLVNRNLINGTNKNGKDGQDTTLIDLQNQSWLTAKLGWDFTYTWSMTPPSTWPELKNVQPFAVRGAVSAGSVGMGSVTPSDTIVPTGTSVVFTATHAAGYRFVQWSDGHRVTPYTVTVTKDTTLTAVFERIFTVLGAVDAGSTGMGTVTPSDTIVAAGKPVVLTATPAAGYRFVQWSDGHRLTPYTFTVTKDITLTAVFERIFHVKGAVNAGSTDMGTVTPSDTIVTVGASVVLTAIPRPGHHFVQWREDNNTVPARRITVTRDTTFTAIFARDGNYRITLLRTPEAWGTVSGAGDYMPGTEVEIGATAAEGYHFVKWMKDGNREASRRITLTQDTTLTALFLEGATASATYLITVNTNDGRRGTVSGEGIYEQNEPVEITATPNKNYHFVSWQDYSKENPRTITVVGRKTYTAEFALGIVGITDPVSSAGAAVIVYPNPVRNVLHLQSSVAVEQIRIYNLSGQQVKHVASPGTQVNVSDLPAGLYFVRIITADGNETIQKIVNSE
jgi:hypothetical protein